MSPKPRRACSRDASEPSRGKEGREAEGEAISIVDEEAKAGVAALLTPDAEALAAVCNSDDDEEEEDEGQELDTGDVTIREGEGREDYLVREGGKERRQRRSSLLASLSDDADLNSKKKKNSFKKKKKAPSSRPTSS